MEKINKTLKNSEKAITLISLVVTIIVLLILAGISISMLSGDNGILQKATEAKIRTERQSIVEQARTDVLDYQAENRGEDLDKSQLKSVLDTYFKEVPTVEELPDGEDLLKREFTTLDKYGTHTIRVSEIYNGNIKVQSDEKEQEIQIGSNVTYSPTGGTYIWDMQYASSDQTETETLDSRSGGTYRNENWKVFKIDNKLGVIQLIPNNPIGLLRFQGAQGYNNNVKMLDDTCEALYSYSSKGITAKSIDMDDIEPLLDDTKRTNGTNYGVQGTRLSGAYFPKIYEEENKSVIGGNEKSGGLELSDPGSKLYARDEATSLTNLTATTNATNGYFRGKSIQPYSSFYSILLNTSDNYKKDGDKYSTMLGGSFWVASRCIFAFSSCEFGIRVNEGGNLTYRRSMNQKGVDPRDSGSFGIFPVITLSIDLISSEGNNFKVNL